MHSGCARHQTKSLCIQVTCTVPHRLWSYRRREPGREGFSDARFIENPVFRISHLRSPRICGEGFGFPSAVASNLWGRLRISYLRSPRICGESLGFRVCGPPILWSPVCQPFEKLIVNSAKAAIAKHNHHVATLGPTENVTHNGLHVR